MNQLTDRREFLLQTSAASLGCLGALAPAAVAWAAGGGRRAAEAAGGFQANRREKS